MIQKPLLYSVLAGGLAFFSALPAAAMQDNASAQLQRADGSNAGTVELRQMPGGVLLHAQFRGLPPGTHAFHVHETGTCEPPFKSAGGHYAPAAAKHGIANPEGPHAGDMPNIHVPEPGTLEIEVLNQRLRLDDSLFDADGAALLIHQGPDDYQTDPAGAAGDRIACGVIRH